MERVNFYSYRKLGCLVLFLSAVGFLGCSETIVEVRPDVKPPTPVAVNSTIFFDDFSYPQRINRNIWVSNGKRHWIWQGRTSEEPGCVDGCLKQNNEYGSSGNVLIYVQTPQFSNGTIETKMRMNFDKSISPNQDELNALRYYIGPGIVFRLTDIHNYYMFRLAGEEGCVLGRMVNGKWYDFANPRRVKFLEGGRIKPNYWYKLKVKVIGGNIQCFINDSPVINYSDYESKGGKKPITVGHLGLSTFKCFADFEYIKVYQ